MDRKIEKRIVELEKEVQFYKHFVQQLPFSFQFTDYSLGMAMTKKRGTAEPEIRFDVATHQLPAELQLDIDPISDLPFEKVEAFLSPILDLVPHHIVFVDGNGIVLCSFAFLCYYLFVMKQKNNAIG